MFTGLIEAMGKVQDLRLLGAENQLVIEQSDLAREVNLGDSIAINGVCLTVSRITGSQLIFDVMPETLRRTSLHLQTRGSMVNMERALALGDRLGGHLVSGHIDGVGHIVSRRPEGNAVLFHVHAPPEVSDYLVKKGSVAIDGISLTIGDLTTGGFWVSIIPHTLKSTALQYRKPGEQVNLEGDMIGKYVAHYLRKVQPSDREGVTTDLLLRTGFLSD